jgi:hypothetical protein
MSLTANSNTQRVDVPNEQDEWIEFKALGFADIKAAQRASQQEGRQQLREMGPELYQVVQNRPTNGAKTAVDPLNTHDMLTLLDRGITGWSDRLHLPARSEDSRQQQERLAVLGAMKPSVAEWAARSLMAAAGIADAWGVDANAIEAESRAVDEGESDFPTMPTSVSLLRSTGS